jgi:hypothetical protein
LDDTIIVNVRRPRFIRDAMEAGLEISRLGMHDDALLADESDRGTYDDPDYSRSEELQWMEEQLELGVNGGEMSRVSGYTQATIADQILRKMNISYLNGQFNEDVLNQWKSQTLNGKSAYDQIEKHLGYRLFVEKAELPSFIETGKNFYYKMKLNNSGYAAIQDEYFAYLVIKDSKDKYTFPLTSWELHQITSGTSVTNLGKVQWPKNLTSDIVQIGITITSKGLDTDSEYKDCVILANEGFSYLKGVNYFATYTRKDGIYQLVTQE